MAYGRVVTSSGRELNLSPEGWINNEGINLNEGGNRLSAVLGNVSPRVDLDYSSPRVELANGVTGYRGKGLYAKNLYDAEGNLVQENFMPGEEAKAMARKKFESDQRLADAKVALVEAQTRDAGRGAKAPAGYRYTADGGMEPIPGGPADTKAQGKFNQDMASMNATESALSDLATQVNQLASHKGLDAATGWRSVLPSMPGGDAKNFEALLDTLRSKTAFGTLQAMRDASKTGGALGAVSEKELKLLESNLAALDKAQSPEQFRSELQKILKYTDEAKGRTRNAFNVTHNGRQPQQMPQPGGYNAEDLMHTAQKHGISVDEVIRRMGAK